MQVKGKQTDKQQQILDAAVRIFAEKGYAAASTSEIAKAAGVAEGTIFRHYGTKENLLLAVLVPFLMEAAPVIADELVHDVLIPPHDSLASFLRALIINRLAFLEANREIFKILVMELLHRDDLRQQFFGMFQKRVLKHLYTVIEVYRERGEVADIPAEAIVELAGTYLFGYFFSRFALLPGQPLNHEAEADRMVGFILRGIGG
nr:TetR/AcrR family transcriptional regulator [Ectobacillus ponti]